MRPKWKRWLVVGSAVLLGLVAGIVTWGIWGSKDSAWYSAWASAASAVVAVFALGAASVAAIATIETNRNQSAQLERLEEAQRREQASKVAVWLQSADSVDLPGDGSHRVLRYHNAGPLPVYDVELTFFFGGQQSTYRMRALGPTTSPESLKRPTNVMLNLISKVAKAHLNVEPPRDLEANTSAANAYKKALIEAGNRLFHESPIEIQLEFSDGESRWRRLSTGRLDLVGHIHTLVQAKETDTAGDPKSSAKVEEQAT